MKVGFATADWAVKATTLLGDPTYGGAGWARIGLPARHLGDGFEVSEGTLSFDSRRRVFLVRRMTRRDPLGKDPIQEDFTEPELVVLQRWMHAETAEHTQAARASGQVVVNDVDDHFWALDPRNQAARASDPKLNPTNNRTHYLEALKVSDAVTVSTPYLAAELRRLGVRCPIFLVENAVDVAAYGRVRRNRTFPERPTIGWVGGTSWRSGDLQELRGLLDPFLRSNGLRAHHSGHIDRPGVPTFAGETRVDPELVSTLPLVPIHDYPRLMVPVDVGLVPLRDVPFNRAKSWIKGTEYAAAGVPFVASALPEYRRLRDEHEIGRVARKAKEWLAHWRDLLDPEVRRAESERQAKAVEALDIRVRIERWREVYLALAG